MFAAHVGKNTGQQRAWRGTMVRPTALIEKPQIMHHGTACAPSLWRPARGSMTGTQKGPSSFSQQMSHGCGNKRGQVHKGGPVVQEAWACKVWTKSVPPLARIGSTHPHVPNR